MAVESTDPPPETPAQLGTDQHSSTNALSTIKAEPSQDEPLADFPPLVDAGRPSRRPRATVSYAEPNLRHKMRRPTKELVDAVSGGNHGPRGSSVQWEHDEQESLERDKGGDQRVKQEPDESGASAKLSENLSEGSEAISGRIASPPPSPLCDKGQRGLRAASSNADTSMDPHLPPSVLTDRRRRSSSVPGGTLAALMEGSARRISRVREAAEAARERSADVERLDRVPHMDENGDAAHRSTPDEDDKGERTISRRHSSMVDVGGKMSSVGKSANDRISVSDASSRGGLVVRGRRRRETQAGDQPESDHAELEERAISYEKGNSIVVREDMTSRASRAALRRRSMML